MAGSVGTSQSFIHPWPSLFQRSWPYDHLLSNWLLQSALPLSPLSKYNIWEDCSIHLACEDNEIRSFFFSINSLVEQKNWSMYGQPYFTTWSYATIIGYVPTWTVCRHRTSAESINHYFSVLCNRSDQSGIFYHHLIYGIECAYVCQCDLCTISPSSLIVLYIRSADLKCQQCPNYKQNMSETA